MDSEPPLSKLADELEAALKTALERIDALPPDQQREALQNLLAKITPPQIAG